MNPTLVAALLGAITGAGTTGLFAILNARLQARQQFAIGHSKDVWAARFASFKELWTLTSALPRYWVKIPPRSMTDATCNALHEWFFRGGGLLLTNEARRRYFDVQNALREVSSADISPDAPLSGKEVERLFRLGEALRVQLCYDLVSRNAVQITRCAGRQMLLSGHGTIGT